MKKGVDESRFNIAKKRTGKIFRKVLAALLVFVFAFAMVPFFDAIECSVNAEPTELNNRICISYPNDTHPYIEQVFDKNNWKLSKAGLLNSQPHTYIIPGVPGGNSSPGDNGGVSASQKIDILNNDFSVTYSMTHKSHSTGRDYGNAFTIYNDDAHYKNTCDDQNYGALGLYRKIGTAQGLAPNNSLAVEFDPYNFTGAAEEGRLDIVPSIGDNEYGPHIAITEPDRTNIATMTILPHDALSAVAADRFSDDQWGTARVEWFLLNPGTSDAYSDNIYRFQYSYWYSQYAKGSVKSDATSFI